MPLLALGSLFVIQALNPSHRFQSTDQSLFPLSHVKWLPSTVDVASTWNSFGMLLTYAALIWTVCTLTVLGVANSTFARRHFDFPFLLFSILAASGFIMALASILHHLSGDNSLLWMRPSVYGSRSAGPFVNRNNFAAYMNLLIPITLGLAASSASLMKFGHARGRSSVVSQLQTPSFLLYFAVAVMILSVFITGSRAGMAICALIVAFWIISSGWRAKQGRELASLSDGARPPAVRWRRSGLTFACLCLIIAGLLFIVGVGPFKPQLARLNHFSSEVSESGRLAIYRGALDVVKDHLWFGTGAGTFAAAFPYYQPASLHGFFRYAHNDWLQWLSELGIIGSGLAVATLIAIVFQRAAINHAQDRGYSSSSTMLQFRLPLILALAGVSLHALVDFPLHIPGVAVLVVSLLAILGACSCIASARYSEMSVM